MGHIAAAAIGQSSPIAMQFIAKKHPERAYLGAATVSPLNIWGELFMRVESNTRVESNVYCVLCIIWLKSKIRNEIYAQFGVK